MSTLDREIDYMIAVAECRSISRAAEILYISQPSLSRFLTNLERELGVSLFVRTANGTELTQAGQIYVKYAKEIRLLRSTMRHELKTITQQSSSKIRVGMTLNAASLSAFSVAEEVRKRYPHCTVELFNILSKDMGSLLKENQYDFVIGPDFNLLPDLKSEVFYQDSMILVVPKRYHLEAYVEDFPGSKFPYIDLRKIPSLDYIFQDHVTYIRKVINRLLQEKNLTIEPRLVVTGSTLAIQAAENQMGCCIVGTGHLAYVNHTEQLKFYQISDNNWTNTAIISLKSKHFTPEERYCISCIKRSLTEGETKIRKRCGGIA